MNYRKNFVNYSGESLNYEQVKGVSMTVPDQSLTIQNILDRFTSGMNVDTVGKTPAYDIGDGIGDDIAVDAYQRYDDNPDDLTAYTEMQAKVDEKIKDINKKKTDPPTADPEPKTE